MGVPETRVSVMSSLHWHACSAASHCSLPDLQAQRPLIFQVSVHVFIPWGNLLWLPILGHVRSVPFSSSLHPRPQRSTWPIAGCSKHISCSIKCTNYATITLHFDKIITTFQSIYVHSVFFITFCSCDLVISSQPKPALLF